METSVRIGGDQAFALKHALLVYGDGSRSFATLHEPMDVEASGADGERLTGAPVLGPGQMVSTAFLKALAGELGAGVPAEVLPPHVLVRTADVTVWWRPRSVAPLFYRLAESAKDRKKLAACSGKPVPHPALVFRASRGGLWVRALAGNERPTATTQLYQAPYYNVGKTGSVCVGSMRKPTGRGLDALEGWERSFFESEFTHQLPGTTLTRHRGGFVGLWTELARKSSARVRRRPRFPVEKLQRAGKQTLATFVTSDERGAW